MSSSTWHQKNLSCPSFNCILVYVYIFWHPYRPLLIIQINYIVWELFFPYEVHWTHDESLSGADSFKFADVMSGKKLHIVVRTGPRWLLLGPTFAVWAILGAPRFPSSPGSDVCCWVNVQLRADWACNLRWHQSGGTWEGGGGWMLDGEERQRRNLDRKRQRRLGVWIKVHNV